MPNILVSIIIATYNSEKTIRIALESVLKQKFQDWECIVVDGDSKDSTINIVSEFIRIDPRFSMISEPDNGIYDAFNKGWRLAKGEWVHYLGSDDKLTSTSFCELLKNEISSDIVVVSGSAYIEKSDSIVVQKSNQWAGCHQAKLTRRSVLESMGGFDETFKILADKDLYLRISAQGYKVVNVDSIVAYFSMNGISADISYAVARFRENKRMYSNDPNTRFPLLLSLYIFFRTVLSNMYHTAKAHVCK